MTLVALNATEDRYPARLRERLGDAAPALLSALGNLDLLALPKAALFCSARCPGDAIVRTYDQAARWRDADRCVISGFHSPIEKECLSISYEENRRSSFAPLAAWRSCVFRSRGERR